MSKERTIEKSMILSIFSKLVFILFTISIYFTMYKINLGFQYTINFTLI